MKLVYIKESDKIAKYADVVFELCQKAYEPIGGFNSLQSVRDIPSRVKLIKLAMSKDVDDNNAIGGCALYRYINDGYKCIGYAGNKGTVPDYRECVQAIIQDDIAKYNNWYWVEASGVVQHYFEKHNGYIIPNRYVPVLLKKEMSKDDLLADGFSYRTTIGRLGNQTEVIKRLCGFPNKDAYDMLMGVYGTLDNFSKEIRGLLDANKTGAMTESISELPRSISIPVMYIHNLDECIMENGFNEVPPDWMDMLNRTMDMLRHIDETSDNESVKNAIEIGADLQRRLSVISLGQFHTEPRMPHIVF